MTDIEPVEMHNYKSATTPLTRCVVNKQILEEVVNGHYKVVNHKPTIVSALGAVPKKDSDKIRLIHDCSQPPGQALNDYSHNDEFSYQRLQDAIDLIKPGSYMSKIDLSNAYRSVKIHPTNFEATGLKWTFSGNTFPTYMVDTRLPFGACKSPQIFNTLSQAACHIARISGVQSLVCFLDDYLVIGDTYEQCLRDTNALYRILRKLGFGINYKKMEGPCRRLIFLGIILDTEKMTVEMPTGKLTEFHLCVQKTFTSEKVTKRHLQSLAGKLNWASQCIYGSRFHVQGILARIKGLKKPWHRARVTNEMRRDLAWWLRYMEHFNGTVPMVDNRPGTPLVMDACPEASGAFYHGDWYHARFHPALSNMCINYKEIMALEPAVVRWGKLWQDKKVYVYSDNQTAVALINKGRCADPIVMQSLRNIFWHSAVHNFRLQAQWYPGYLNGLADAASRLHESGGVHRLTVLLKHWSLNTGLPCYLPTESLVSCRITTAQEKFTR